MVASRADRPVEPDAAAADVAESILPTPVPLTSATPLPTPLPDLDNATIVDTAVTFWRATMPFDVPEVLEKLADAFGPGEQLTAPDAAPGDGAPSPGSTAPAQPDAGGAAEDPPQATPAPQPLPLPLPPLEPIATPVPAPVPPPLPLPTVDLTLATPTIPPLLP